MGCTPDGAGLVHHIIRKRGKLMRSDKRGVLEAPAGTVAEDCGDSVAKVKQLYVRWKI